MFYDIRWKQRFQNYSRAFNLLRDALESKELSEFSDLELEGIIQRFEYTFELAWKVWKDYLENDGVELSRATPKPVIKECAASGIFEEAEISGDIYINMLESRNLLSHTYDFKIFKRELINIKQAYLPELEKQYLFLLEKAVEEHE